MSDNVESGDDGGEEEVDDAGEVITDPDQEKVTDEDQQTSVRCFLASEQQRINCAKLPTGE